MALNAEVGEQANLDTTPVAEQEAVEEVESSEPTGSEESTETTGESKKGYQNRVRELNQRAKAAEERARSLEETVAALTQPAMEMPNMPRFDTPVVQPGEEIDAQEFERRILQRANASAELRMRQAEAVSRISNETQEVIRQHPELDPDSDSYDAELSDSITEATDAYIRSNPYTASVKTFVNKLMKPYKGAVDKGAGKATENVVKQVSQAALRPNSVKQPEKTAAEKSIEELEAELGVVIS